MFILQNAALLLAAVQLLFQFPSFVDADTSIPIVASASNSAFAIETNARKRLGRKSFLQKQERGTLPQITSPPELQTLAQSYALRTPGSISHRKAFKNYCDLAVQAIRHDLSQTLPHPSHKAKFENLFFRLGVAADTGAMPDFSDAGARSGYALEFFCRARSLADLWMDVTNREYVFPEWWVADVLESPLLGGGVGGDGGEVPYCMVSLGGGPGFDFVGAALASSFSTSTSTTGREGSTSTRSIKATILDYEEGWADLVQAMDLSTRKILQQPHFSCNWGGKCDITKPITDPSNAACLEAMKSTDLWICQYCVAENANLLKESDYIFFRDLFDNAKDGAVFIITETRPNIWPDMCNLMKEHCTYMQIGFNKNGRQMVLRKGMNATQSTPLISKKDLALLKQFENIEKYQKRKIDSGWERQERKIRGNPASCSQKLVI